MAFKITKKDKKRHQKKIIRILKGNKSQFDVHSSREEEDRRLIYKNMGYL